MPFPPAAFIIGAQKSGTTSLAAMLDAQPDITLSLPKETQFFTRHWAEGTGWYRDRFNGANNSIFLDASPDYAAAPTKAFPKEAHPGDPSGLVPERICSLNPDARFIYLLREPTARVYSSYWHAVRAGYATRNFRAAIENYPTYLRTSDYAGQLHNYLEFFPLENFLLLDFQSFTREPEEVLRKCCRFLGVQFEHPAISNDDQHKNKSYQLSPLAKFVRTLTGSNENFKALSRTIRSVTPKYLAHHIAPIMTRTIPRMEERDQLYLAKLFKDRNIELNELTGFDISGW